METTTLSLRGLHASLCPLVPDLSFASDASRPRSRSSRPPASWGGERASQTRLRRVEQPLSVVVIDDHRDTVDMIAGALRHAGWSVRAFTSAAEGHASIRHALPDVVLTDIAIGDTNGRALLRELRLDPATAKVRVVAMSGIFDPTGPMTSGFDLWLVKPLDVMRLDELLRAACETPRR